MHRTKELCRNFQRGSCQYGDRCKFLHPNQHHKPNNPFGIDHGNQQQLKFGSQPHGYPNLGSQPRNQFKPGENKWNRFNPLAGANSTPARQSDNQGQVADHKCTDPESCKRQIAEDFKNERPLWHLTCYAHWRYLPCDIVGDISYEELRLAAYVDAKQGLDFPSIIARERSLLNSKLTEFDNLLRNPYLRSSNSMSTSPSPFSGVSVNASMVGDQNKVPSPVSSFSQLGFSTSEVPNKSLPTRNFGDPRPFQISSSVDLGMNNQTARSQGIGAFERQLPSSSITKFDNISTGTGGSPFLANSTSSFSTFHPEMPNLANSLVAAVASQDNHRTANLLEEGSIWLKEKWSPGEIPEDAPPDGVIWS